MRFPTPVSCQYMLLQSEFNVAVKAHYLQATEMGEGNLRFYTFVSGLNVRSALGCESAQVLFPNMSSCSIAC